MSWRNKDLNKANRGTELEEMIMRTNQRYRFLEEAVVHKISTPVKVLNVTQSGKITDGYYEKKSTVDFEGNIEGGRSVAFEAKQTKIETRFDLSNIDKHQREYLGLHQKTGGISFVIVRFMKLQEIYYLPYDELHRWQYEESRKSIPYDAFEHRIRADGLKEVDYLNNIKELEG